MVKPKLVISNMYRAKNKYAFFAMHQAITKLPELDIEFHILWDDYAYEDSWTKKINELGCKIVPYTKKQLDEYCIGLGVPQSKIDQFKNFGAIYFIIHAHYLYSHKITDYYLIYDDDIYFKDDLQELKHCLINKIPCLIAEPMNSYCDKVMANTLFDLYPGAKDYYIAINPQILGFNAGFQGISLDMYEDFLDPQYFNYLLGIFNYNGIYDENGKEITGPKRTMIDTQQQSFFGIMNIIRSKTTPHILNPSEYFVCPNWGTHPIYGQLDPTNEYEGWDINMKSKVVHFIGHTKFNGVYYGKPKVFYKLVDEYLNAHGIYE